MVHQPLLKPIRLCPCQIVVPQDFTHQRIFPWGVRMSNKPLRCIATSDIAHYARFIPEDIKTLS